MTEWKSKIGVVSRVIGLMESESEESECFHLSDSVYNSVTCDPVKSRLSESEAEVEEPTNSIKSGIKHCHWFNILLLLLATPTEQFSLDRKQQSQSLVQNQYSASDSVSFIFTRSYRSTLLSTTLSMTPSLVKTNLKYIYIYTSIYMYYMYIRTSTLIQVFSTLLLLQMRILMMSFPASSWLTLFVQTDSLSIYIYIKVNYTIV